MGIFFSMQKIKHTIFPTSALRSAIGAMTNYRSAISRIPTDWIFLDTLFQKKDTAIVICLTQNQHYNNSNIALSIANYFPLLFLIR